MKLEHFAALALLAGGSLAFCASCASHPKPVVTVYELPPSSPYATPLISPGTKFGALPPAVQNTIRAETGGAEIEDIRRDTVNGQPLYRIYFTKADVLPPLYVAPDGSVLNPDLTVAVGAGRDSVGFLTGGGASGVTLGDLPPKAVKAIQQHAPQAEISSISKENRGDQAVYIVSFKDPKQPTIEITPEGVVVVPPAPIRVPDRRRQ